MIFNDSTLATVGLIQRCEDWTGIGDGGISGDSTTLKKFTSHINEALYDVTVEIAKSHDGFDPDDSNYTDYPAGTFALTTNRDYVFASSLKFLSLKRLDVSYDGTTFYKATPIDSSQIEALGNATDEDANFTITSPRYDPKSNGFFLYPKATAAQVSAGATARIEFERGFDEFTSSDTTQEPGIDRPWHELVAVRASMKWAAMKDAEKYKVLAGEWLAGVEAMRVHYGRKNKDEALNFSPQIPNYR
jgi:hypothetical protein